MGCGECDSITKSTTSGSLISDASTIFREAKALYERINVPCIELRGVGIQLTKLEKCPPVNSALSNFLNQCPSTSKNNGFRELHSKNQLSSRDNQKKIETRTVVSKRGRATRGRGGRKNVTSPSNGLGRYFNTHHMVCLLNFLK